MAPRLMRDMGLSVIVVAATDRPELPLGADRGTESWESSPRGPGEPNLGVRHLNM